ncbi:TPA: hypothetical protein ACGO1T_001948, partial [Streptococcus suis]
MAGDIRRVRNGKGYESLPRELLQRTDMHIGSVGLLCQLLSYPDDWKLYKTEVLYRFEKDGRRTVDKYWDELIGHGYIIQFKKRIKKKSNYIYFFNDTPFTADD